MVFRKGRQVIMSPAMNAYQGDLAGIELLQFFAVADGYQPVTGAVQYIGMAVYFPDPFIRMQVVPQYPFMREDGYKPFHHFDETEIRRIQYQVARLIICCKLGGKAAAEAAAVYDHVVLCMAFQQLLIYMLHIRQHFLLAAFARAFPEAAVIYQHHIILVPVKIPCILRPSFNAFGIAMQVQHQAFGLIAIKMQSVDAYSRRHIKKQFFKRDIIFVCKILRQFLRLEN